MLFDKGKTQMPGASNALPGRAEPIPTASHHFLSGQALKGPYPAGCERIVLGMGCFWGAERKFWSLDGVHVTAAGYAQGSTPNATYREVCSGKTGHNEVVLVVYDPKLIGCEQLLKVFWESHDPTQMMRQGNDIGTQYRSGIYFTTAVQHEAALTTKAAFGAALRAKGLGAIATEIAPAGPFYFAEDAHQQYLAKNPRGYCGLGGTGVDFPIGIVTAAE